jgi:adenylate kinase
MRLILIGPPGSGKGTQGRLLAKEFRVPHIATGELIREEIAKQSEFGLLVEASIAKGQLLDDLTALHLLTRRLDVLKRGFVLDGFPRTVNQAKLLIDVEELNPLSAAIYFDLGDQEAVSRLTGRLTCPVCGRSYHAGSEPPLLDGLCDDDCAELFRRPEDNPEAIVTRLRLFHEQTQPLLSFFEEISLLVKVDASSVPADIFESTVTLLTEKVQ